MVALTATAPRQLLKEICTSLSMANEVSLSFPLDRPNIFVHAMKSSYTQVFLYLQVIVYISDQAVYSRKTSGLC